MRKTYIYSKLAQQLGEIAKEYDLIFHFHKPPFRIFRTRAGYWQRAAGAWVFALTDSEGHEIFGSCYTAKNILRAYKEKKLSQYSVHGNTELCIESLRKGKGKDG